MLLAAKIFTCLCSFVLPCSLAIFFCYSLRDGWKWLLYGCLCYVLLGMLARLSLLSFFNSFGGFKAFIENHAAGYALLTALLDSFLVVGGSWLVIKVCGMPDTSIKDAMDYGTGLAGMASLLLVGVSSVQLFFMKDVALPASMIFFAGLERLSVLLVTMAWSVWVLKSIQEKKIVLLAGAFAAEFAMNSIGMLLNSVWHTSLWIGNLILLAMAAGMLYSLFPYIAKEAEANRIAKEKALAKAAARKAAQKKS